MFSKRTIVIATKHNKERVIAPLLDKYLDIKNTFISDFDTDTLGTFSGEKERLNDPVTTVRNKCLEAMQEANCDLGIANEGSFGSHPTLFFCAADEEFMIFIDRKNKLEIIERIISTETNFVAKEITTESELETFLQQVQFPLHGVILRKSKDEKIEIFKNLQDEKLVKEIFNLLIKKYQKAYIETDMRAMYNPTRMKVIEQVTEKLMHKILSKCPACNTPGYSVTNAKAGLPCMQCSLPTKSTLSYIYSCAHCSFTEEKKYPHNKELEDPMYCDYCNP